MPYLHASYVKSLLVSHQTAGNMNELTQERSLVLANIVKSLFVTHHTVGNMKRDVQDPSLLKQHPSFKVMFKTHTQAKQNNTKHNFLVESGSATR